MSTTRTQVSSLGTLTLQDLLETRPPLLTLLFTISPESFVKSNLWLMVNPNLACPIKYMKRSVLHVPTVTVNIPVELKPPRHATARCAHGELCASAAAAPSCRAQCAHASSSTGFMVLGSLRVAVVLLFQSVCKYIRANGTLLNQMTRSYHLSTHAGSWHRAMS